LRMERGAFLAAVVSRRDLSWFVFTVPKRCTPAHAEVPALHELAPWVAPNERLRDEPECEARRR
jgi:hypothetical protein